jgi:hypothetical protein
MVVISASTRLASRIVIGTAGRGAYLAGFFALPFIRRGNGGIYAWRRMALVGTASPVFVCWI